MGWNGCCIGCPSSPHAPNFLLKGALLFSLWYDHPHRPTRDVDLLGFGPADIDSAVAAFREICRIAADDGILFDIGSIKGADIRKEAGYGGIRIDIRATLDGARIALQVDIGFGDAVTPTAEAVIYPVLLEDLPAPQLRAYPKYTVVAEKLHAICLLGMVNTRMKDYFDLDALMAEGTLDPTELRRAIDATFARRVTALPISMPPGLDKALRGRRRQAGAMGRISEKEPAGPSRVANRGHAASKKHFGMPGSSDPRLHRLRSAEARHDLHKVRKKPRL